MSSPNSAPVVQETCLQLPGQINLYRGKVGDVYTVSDPAPDAEGALLFVVRTDRISAYDAQLPRPIPHKGQVLNQISATMLRASSQEVPNWFLDAPDPNVTVGHRAEPIKVEMIVRGYLLGSAWRSYQAGERKISGVYVPNGMEEFERFEQPIITPTTKADEGHDENITPAEILEKRLATRSELTRMMLYSMDLFTHGQEMAATRDLTLADTKYEFGRLAAGAVVAIDEVNTPDSSRYMHQTALAAYITGLTEVRPTQLSKEFVREWLAEQGFMGRTGDVMPEVPDEFVTAVSARYIELYERLLGVTFEPPTVDAPPEERIEQNILKWLDRRAG